jgi:hypothetical protein
VKPTKPYEYAERFLDIYDEKRERLLDVYGPAEEYVDLCLADELVTSMEWRAIRETIARGPA